MSQAFTREGDASEDPPERPVSDRPNYVTSQGLADLRARLDELTRRRSKVLDRSNPESDAQRRLVERDMRYVEARIEGAILVDRRSRGLPDDIRFGATVLLRDAAGEKRLCIVGEDEADPAQGRLSWCSPLAMALMGAKPGDEVAWEGPGGRSTARVLEFSYPD